MVRMSFWIKKSYVRLILVVLTACFCLSLPLNALAVPQSKLNEAKAAKEKVDALAHDFAFIVDEYNGAQEAHDAAVAKHAEAEVQLGVTADRLGEVQGYLNKQAVSMYRQGPLALLDVLLGASTFKEFTATWDILSGINEQNSQNISELSKLKAEQVQLKSILSEQELIAAQKAQEMETKKVQIEAQLAEQEQIVAGLEAEIAELRAQEAAAAEAAARRASQTTIVSPPPSSGGGGYTPPSGSPPPGIVATAQFYLGVPYVWGGSTPAGFDCSGFVQYVYAQNGIAIPRTSYSMMSYGQYVGWSDLQPGDIVVTNGGGHVGIYVGGGQMIHAPQAGDVVSYGAASPFVMGRRP